MFRLRRKINKRNFDLGSGKKKFEVEDEYDVEPKKENYWNKYIFKNKNNKKN